MPMKYQNYLFLWKSTQITLFMLPIIIMIWLKPYTLIKSLFIGIGLGIMLQIFNIIWMMLYYN